MTFETVNKGFHKKLYFNPVNDENNQDEDTSESECEGNQMQERIRNIRKQARNSFNACISF